MNEILIKAKDLRCRMIAKKGIVDNIFLIIWAIYYSYMFLGTTMISDKWLVLPYRLSMVIGAIIVVYRIITLEKNDVWNFILMCFMAVATGGFLLFRHLKIYFIMALMIVAAKDVEFDRILKLTLIIGTLIMAVALISSQIGLVEDLVYFHRGANRHSLGISYTTDCAAHVFYLAAGYFLIKKGQLKAIEYIFFICLTILLYYMTRARNNTICLLLLIFATVIYQLLFKNSFTGKGLTTLRYVLGGAFILFFLGCILIAIFLMITYKNDGGIITYIDNIFLGNRIGMGNTAYIEHGLKLFGSDIPQMGYGRTTIAPEWYFCLDSSYMLVLLERGILIFIMMIAMTLKVMIKGIKNNIYLTGIMALIALQCLVEHHWMELAYNFFLLATFAAINCEINFSKKSQNI